MVSARNRGFLSTEYHTAHARQVEHTRCPYMPSPKTARRASPARPLIGYGAGGTVIGNRRTPHIGLHAHSARRLSGERPAPFTMPPHWGRLKTCRVLRVGRESLVTPMRECLLALPCQMRCVERRVAMASPSEKFCVAAPFLLLPLSCRHAKSPPRPGKCGFFFAHDRRCHAPCHIALRLSCADYRAATAQCKTSDHFHGCHLEACWMQQAKRRGAIV